MSAKDEKKSLSDLVQEKLDQTAVVQKSAEEQKAADQRLDESRGERLNEHLDKFEGILRLKCEEAKHIKYERELAPITPTEPFVRRRRAGGFNLTFQKARLDIFLEDLRHPEADFCGYVKVKGSSGGWHRSFYLSPTGDFVAVTFVPGAIPPPGRPRSEIHPETGQAFQSAMTFPSTSRDKSGASLDEFLYEALAKLVELSS